ncbi:MAG: fibrobacter succinogenes major paralogous domain-containing protein [Bacteroidales bacterium]|nr:fibrobacter succinogenes major paralogous domain-containing protein [Bacteroidales bacterium]
MKTKFTIPKGFFIFSLLLSGCSDTKAPDTYKTIRIDTQEWMIINLNIEFFRNGDPIPEAKSDEEWRKAGEESKPAWCYYENKSENGSKYGRLYNWYAVTDPRGIAPAGWHVSSDAEWRNTTDFLGGEDAAGTKMKSSSGWTEDGNGTNESGFTGLPGGCRDLNGRFSRIDSIGYWWSSTEYDTALAWYRCIDKSPYYVYRTNYYKQNGLSVRCIRD